MTDVQKRIRDADAWIEAVTRKEGLPGGFEVRCALSADAAGNLGAKPDSDLVREAVSQSLDKGGRESWSLKGIYIWFWRSDGSSEGSQPWPLYVGKTRAVRGMRGRHVDDHIMNPTPKRGMKDMLCDPPSSYAENTLMRFSDSGIVPAMDREKPRSNQSLVGKHMVTQFRPMSVLLLPMSDDEAKPRGLLDDAEGILIAACEFLHRDRTPAPEGALSCMMNSAGKATTLGIGLEKLCSLDEVALVSRKLKVLMETASDVS